MMNILDWSAWSLGRDDLDSPDSLLEENNQSKAALFCISC